MGPLARYLNNHSQREGSRMELQAQRDLGTLSSVFISLVPPSRPLSSKFCRHNRHLPTCKMERPAGIIGNTFATLLLTLSISGTG